MENIPAEYKPISAWNYFWYEILFSLPIIGLVFLIVYSFNDSNINRRNFARSFFCALAIGLILGVIVFILGLF